MLKLPDDWKEQLSEFIGQHDDGPDPEKEQ
jgi:hypothetical protein